MKNTNLVFWKGEKTENFIFDKKQIKITQKDYAFSLIIALYNSEKYIEETLQSIILQDIDFEENIQIIIVDDGSTDNSFSLCESYARRYPNNIILIHKENGGVSSARNVGLRFATGKYINFIDSDDKFSVNVCSKVFNFFNNNENKIDVVTIKNELFGAKKGDSWFNRKFDKGTRVINLWKEPQIYLNSTNCSFFHNRILNQLHFDENLSIAEDLKLVNLVLMNKWAIGVVSDCKYYYRIRGNDDGSLAGIARQKEYWYIHYLENVFFSIYNNAMKRCGFFPEYLQYTLFRDLWNRFNNNIECDKVLKTKEKIEHYKKLLFSALSCIEDKVILNNSFLKSDEQVYFFSIKYGSPTLSSENEKVLFMWEEQNICIKKSLFSCFEKASIVDNKLQLEGYVVINNIHYPLEGYSLSCECGGNEVTIHEIQNTSNNNVAFSDEIILQRRYFSLTIDVKNKKTETVFLYINFFGIKYPIALYGYGQWFALSSKFPNEYYCQNGIYLKIKDGKLVVFKDKRFSSHIRHEISFLKTLLKNKEQNSKIIKYRLAYMVGKIVSRRDIWLISDRKIAAGDNGQAFYEYVKKKWLKINSYFALQKNTEDYPKLKKEGFRLLDLNSRKYKIKFLWASHLISAHFDGLELKPISFDGIHDIIAKKKFVFLQHGITKDDLSSFYSRKRQNLNMFVSCTIPEYNSIINNPNYFCDKNITKLTGFPRFDKLYNDNKKIILIMPTWRNSLCYGNKLNKDSFIKSYYFNFYHSLLSNERLQTYAKENGYSLCYFSHFNILESNTFMADINGLIIPSETERNYVKAFAEASIMVTDYSSTAFDFSYLRKPVVYCQGDREEFFSHHTYTKGYFDYERDGLGPVTYSVDCAVDTIINILKNGEKIDDKYLLRINNFFPFSDKKNCQRVFEAIKSLK